MAEIRSSELNEREGGGFGGKGKVRRWQLSGGATADSNERSDASEQKKQVSSCF